MLFRWGLSFFALVSAPVLFALESVSVELVEPDDFTDFTITDTGSSREVERLAKEWISFLEVEAVKRLKFDGVLTLVFTDIDMAGDFEPWRSTDNPEIRYFRSMYRPRLEFSYRFVDAEGGAVKAGEETLRDVNFELGRSPGYENELLFYEKSLMRGWLMRLDREVRAAGAGES